MFRNYRHTYRAPEGETEGGGGVVTTEPKVEPKVEPKADPKPADVNKTAMAELYAESKARQEKLNAVKAEKAELEEKTAALQEKLDSFGTDPDTVAAMLQEKKDAEEKALRDAQKFDELANRQASEHTRLMKEKEEEAANKLKEVTEKLNALNHRNDELLVSNAFSNSTYVQTKLLYSAPKMRKLFEDHFDIEDGKLVGYSAPNTAARRVPLVNAAGTPLSFDEAMEEIVNADPDKDSMIKSAVRAGARSKQSTNAPGDNGERKTKLFGVEKMAAWKAQQKNDA